jgi:hypothetical protein
MDQVQVALDHAAHLENRRRIIEFRIARQTVLRRVVNSVLMAIDDHHTSVRVAVIFPPAARPHQTEVAQYIHTFLVTSGYECDWRFLFYGGALFLISWEDPVVAVPPNARDYMVEAARAA